MKEAIADKRTYMKQYRDWKDHYDTYMKEYQKWEKEQGITVKRAS